MDNNKRDLLAKQVSSGKLQPSEMSHDDQILLFGSIVVPHFPELAKGEAAGHPFRGNQWTEGTAVRVSGNVIGRGKSGKISQVSPGGTHFGVDDNKGNHLGYYSESDLSVDDGEGKSASDRIREFYLDENGDLDAEAALEGLKAGGYSQDEISEAIDEVYAEIDAQNSVLEFDFLSEGEEELDQADKTMYDQYLAAHGEGKGPEYLFNLEPPERENLLDYASNVTDDESLLGNFNHKGLTSDDPHDWEALMDSAMEYEGSKSQSSSPQAKVKNEEYGWGKLTTVSNGSDYSTVLHPEQRDALAELGDGETYSYQDETGSNWEATRSGDNIEFQGAGRGNENYKMSSTRKELDLDSGNSEDLPDRFVEVDPGKKVSENTKLKESFLESQAKFLEGQSGSKIKAASNPNKITLSSGPTTQMALEHLQDNGFEVERKGNALHFTNPQEQNDAIDSLRSLGIKSGTETQRAKFPLTNSSQTMASKATKLPKVTEGVTNGIKTKLTESATPSIKTSRPAPASPSALRRQMRDAQLKGQTERVKEIKAQMDTERKRRTKNFQLTGKFED